VKRFIRRNLGGLSCSRITPKRGNHVGPKGREGEDRRLEVQVIRPKRPGQSVRSI